jgi:hypothetical protein
MGEYTDDADTTSLFHALYLKSVQDNFVIYMLQYGNFEDWNSDCV